MTPHSRCLSTVASVRNSHERPQKTAETADVVLILFREFPLLLRSGHYTTLPKKSLNSKEKLVMKYPSSTSVKGDNWGVKLLLLFFVVWKLLALGLHSSTKTQVKWDKATVYHYYRQHLLRFSNITVAVNLHLHSKSVFRLHSFEIEL